MAVNIEFLKQVKIPYNVFRPINTTNSSIDINPNARIALLMQSNTGNQLGEPEGWGSFYDIMKLAIDSLTPAPSPSTNIYNSNGALTANRVVTAGAFDFTWNSTGNYILYTNNFTVDSDKDVALYGGTSLFKVGPGGFSFVVGSGNDFKINGYAGATGNVLTSNGAGASPTWGTGPKTIYNNNDSLQGNRIVSMNTFNLSFTGSSTEQFNISGMTSASLQATTLTLTTGVGAGIQMAKHINLLLDPTSELRLNSSVGIEGQAIISQGSGVVPIWEKVARIRTIAVVANHNAVDGEIVLADAGAMGISVMLPSAVGKDNMMVVVRKTDAGLAPITIATGGELINGLVGDTVTGGNPAATYVSNGGDWFSISRI